MTGQHPQKNLNRNIPTIESHRLIFSLRKIRQLSKPVSFFPARAKFFPSDRKNGNLKNQNKAVSDFIVFSNADRQLYNTEIQYAEIVSYEACVSVSKRLILLYQSTRCSELIKISEESCAVNRL